MIFESFPLELPAEEENDIAIQMNLPHNKFATKKIKQVIMEEINIKMHLDFQRNLTKPGNNQSFVVQTQKPTTDAL